jgi:hypothetical protein
MPCYGCEIVEEIAIRLLADVRTKRIGILANGNNELFLVIFLSLVEAGIGPDAARVAHCHQADKSTGIDAARKACADRHVCAHMQVNGRIQQLAQRFHRIRSNPAIPEVFGLYRPVLLRAQLSVG